MWLKKFYYRHKVATRYGLSLLLLTIFFYSLTRLSCFYYLTKVYGEDKEYFPDDVSFSGKRDTTTILTLIEEGKKGNLPAIAGLFSYPIERAYPLPPIKDSAEFVRYGEIIFDDSLCQVLSKTTIEDWDEWGWRGIFLHDYFAESGFDGGKMISIMYKSEEEKKLREQYIKEEIKSLHPSLRKDIDIPIGTYLSADLQWIGRLDLLKSGIHRFSLYKQGSDLLALPYFMATESFYRIEGSEGNQYFEFENDSIKVELLLNTYRTSTFWIKQENDMCPAFWRSLIKDSIPKNQQLSE